MGGQIRRWLIAGAVIFAAGLLGAAQTQARADAWPAAPSTLSDC